MSKHLKLFSALLVLMVLAPISVFVFPSNAEAARSLVENSWRYEDGQLVAEDASSEEDGIALLSMDILPDGATAQGIQGGDGLAPLAEAHDQPLQADGLGIGGVVAHGAGVSCKMMVTGMPCRMTFSGSCACTRSR